MPLSETEFKNLQDNSCKMRHDIIDTTVWAGGAHIGGGTSVIDILVLLYFKYMNVDPKNPTWEERDRLILSKGHAGVGYAPVLAEKGYYDKELLKEFNHFKSPFGMHLDGNKVPGVDASTGSLGHGLPMALGMALGARVQKKEFMTYCILGDGELNEGTNWEAMMAINHFKATNLVTIVDRNMQMIDGRVEEIMGLEPLDDKLRAFGFDVRIVDGHDFYQLSEAIDAALNKPAKPIAIIAKTIKGKGIDFMEDQTKWHYGSIDSELAKKAHASVDKMYGR